MLSNFRITFHSDQLSTVVDNAKAAKAAQANDFNRKTINLFYRLLKSL